MQGREKPRGALIFRREIRGRCAPQLLWGGGSSHAYLCDVVKFYYYGSSVYRVEMMCPARKTAHTAEVKPAPRPGGAHREGHGCETCSCDPLERHQEERRVLSPGLPPGR